MSDLRQRVRGVSRGWRCCLPEIPILAAMYLFFVMFFWNEYAIATSTYISMAACLGGNVALCIVLDWRTTQIWEKRFWEWYRDKPGELFGAGPEWQLRNAVSVFNWSLGRRVVEWVPDSEVRP